MMTRTKLVSSILSAAILVSPAASLAANSGGSEYKDPDLRPVKLTANCASAVNIANNYTNGGLYYVVSQIFDQPTAEDLANHELVTAKNGYSYRKAVSSKSHIANWWLVRQRWGSTLSWMKSFRYRNAIEGGQVVDTTKIEGLLADFDKRVSVEQAFAHETAKELNDLNKYPLLEAKDCTTVGGVKKVKARLAALRTSAKNLKNRDKNWGQKAIHDEFVRLNTELRTVVKNKPGHIYSTDSKAKMPASKL